MSYFWLCSNQCGWSDSDSYHGAIRNNARNGALAGTALDRAIVLTANQAFCMEGLAKPDLRRDLTSPRFSLTAAGGNQVCAWGHHAGFSDLIYLVVVATNSALNQNPNIRPGSWSIKAPAAPALSSLDLQRAIDNW
jgi:hypothetical protein